MCKKRGIRNILHVDFEYLLRFYFKKKEGMDISEKEEGQTSKTNGDYGYEVAKRSGCYGK